MTFGEFCTQLAGKNIAVSNSGGVITLTGQGDSYINSSSLANKLSFGALNKVNGTRLENTKSDQQIYLKEITGIYAPGMINLLVGPDGSEYSRLMIDVSFNLSGLNAYRNIGLDTDTDFLTPIDETLERITHKQTELGATITRLESVLDMIEINQMSLTSTLSTIRDADVAEESAIYVQQQILQQASATLLATTRNLRYENVIGLLQGLRR